MKRHEERLNALPAVGPAYALVAALLFGASTPLAKLLIGGVSPVLLAGILYAASGVSLSAWLLFRRHPREAGIARSDLPWLAGAVFFGGVFAPVLLMSGLARTAKKARASTRPCGMDATTAAPRLHRARTSAGCAQAKRPRRAEWYC